jgi:bacterial/archaeal transporter family-2 protein
MRTLFMLLAVFAGALLPIQASLNAEFAQRGATALWAAAVSAALSSLTFVVVASIFLRIPPPSLKFFSEVPPWLWWGGFIGAFVLGIMSSVPQRIGAATMIVCFVAGQTLCSLALDHYGVLGLPQQEITLGKLAGAGLIVAGVMFVRLL